MYSDTCAIGGANMILLLMRFGPLPYLQFTRLKRDSALLPSLGFPAPRDWQDPWNHHECRAFPRSWMLDWWICGNQRLRRSRIGKVLDLWYTRYRAMDLEANGYKARVCHARVLVRGLIFVTDSSRELAASKSYVIRKSSVSQTLHNPLCSSSPSPQLS
jgi:hypothetical protein